MKDQMKKYIETIVNANGLVTQEALSLKMMGEFPKVTNHDILTALSEAAQDGMVKRFEYNIPSKGYSYRYFYLPFDARLS